jgi:8-oxo-dGTP pyrophosphatase MutT (NUDIX family)
MSDRTIVRPRDAASLILLRESDGGLEVLIGRRGRTARFMPGRYVFPGGRVIASDARPWRNERTGDDGDRRFAALKRAALRETFEETGLVVGRRADLVEGTGPDGASLVEAAYRDHHLAPALDMLRLVGRAITPTQSPIRFHARFFVADGGDAAGTFGAGEELDDVRWHAVETEAPGDMQNVTRFMLRCAVEAWRGRAPATPPLYWHRGSLSLVRHGSPAR